MTAEWQNPPLFFWESHGFKSHPLQLSHALTRPGVSNHAGQSPTGSPLPQMQLHLRPA